MRHGSGRRILLPTAAESRSRARVPDAVERPRAPVSVRSDERAGDEDFLHPRELDLARGESSRAANKHLATTTLVGDVEPPPRRLVAARPREALAKASAITVVSYRLNTSVELALSGGR